MTVLFFIEGGPRIGMGHAERCRLLALEAARRGHGIAVMMRGPASLIAERNWPDRNEETYVAEDHDDASTIATATELAGKLKPSLAVVDGYGFLAAGLPGRLRGSGIPVLSMVDDQQAFPDVDTDFILNPNLPDGDAEETGPAALLHGPRYAMVPEGPERQEATHRAASAPRVLITLGGADPTDATPRAVALADAYGTEGTVLDVVIGPHFKNQATPDSSRYPIHVHHGLKDLGPLMCDADLMITASGTTSFQGCRWGLPMIAVVVADNQRQLATTLEDAGAAITLSRRQLDDPLPDPLASRVAACFRSAETRRAMSAAGTALVDGAGVSRVADRIGL